MNLQKQKRWISVTAVILLFAVAALCLNNARAQGNQEKQSNQEQTEHEDNATVPPTTTPIPVDAERIYEDFVKKVKSEKLIGEPGDKLYTATMQSGEGEKLLLITDGIISDHTSAHAYIYQLVGENVIYIGYYSSTGSGYPLCSDGPYILAGFHHSSTKLKVDNGIGTIDEVDGFGLDKETYTIREYTLENNKKTNISEKTITSEEAAEADYYYDSESDTMKGTPIIFKKFTSPIQTPN